MTLRRLADHPSVTTVPHIREDIPAKIKNFEAYLRSIFDIFLREDTQLPLWQPPLPLADKTREHIADLKIPTIYHLSPFPLLLLHNLGQPSHDAQLAERVDRLFSVAMK